MGSPLCHLSSLHLLFLLTTCDYFMVINSISSLQPRCHGDESSALMQFKQSFSLRKFASSSPHAYSKVSLWKRRGEGSNSSSSDCCSWDGVTCDEDTGHVIGLDLSSSYLHGSINSNSSLFHLVHLHSLNLADNGFNDSVIPSGFGGLSKLTYLSLSLSGFIGRIPLDISNLTKLTSLDLSNNLIVGQIPSTFGNLTQLVHLNLASCFLTGPIPESISQLVNLQSLSLYTNSLNGTVKLDMFLTLKNLRGLLLSDNELTFLTTSPTNASLLPKFKNLELASCNLIAFPDFLKKQDDLQSLILRNNSIHGPIPKWIWNTSKETLLVMDISENFLTFDNQPPLVLPWGNLRILDLSSNMMKGSPPIPPLTISFYRVSNNKFTGEIPQSFCNLSSAFVLDLSSNNLSGVIPQCLVNSSDSLSVLNIGSNNLDGPIPQVCKKGSKIMMINFGRNQLQGPVPRSLASCTFLEIFDLGNNQINDTFPFWLGTLSNLKVLILKFNKFHGAILNLYSNVAFPSLHIIDLSHNSFTGQLPSNYFQSWKAMKTVDEESTYMVTSKDLHTPGQNWTLSYFYSITLTNKGVETAYMGIQSIFTAIDLSSNQFEGEIPGSMGILRTLHMLNLSNNNLIGQIPSSFGNLTELESLDLSQNKLSGQIPPKLAQLTFLESFNVSHNHLTGPVPQGRQFDTFINGSYEGNSGLCGNTLSKKCGNLEASPPPSSPPPSKLKIDDHLWFLVDKSDWIVICMGYGGGLIVGLIIGHSLTTRYHEWFVSTFERNQTKQRTKNKSRRRS